MLLEVKDVSKAYGSNLVLKKVNLSIEHGQTHALLGLNGAGKSTLVNIICGLIGDFTGDVLFEGENVARLNVLERQAKGIYLVPQHAAIVPEYSLCENIYLGAWPCYSKGKRVNWDQLYQEGSEHLKKYGMNFNPRMKASALSLVDKRKLNIIRALFSDAKLVLLDEPTTSLTSAERDELFEFIRDLQQTRGTSFLFISHYLDEVMKITSRITVIRDGESFSNDTHENDAASIASQIVGEEVTLLQRNHPVLEKETPVLLECEHVYADNVTDVSCSVRAGEIVGCIGQPGSGAREFLRALYGLNPIISGTMKVAGKPVPNPKTPEKALHGKVVYTPYDRHSEGLAVGLSIKNNINLSILSKRLRKWGGIVDTKMENELANEYFGKLSIKAHSIDALVDSLSGGNQQKVLVAKAINCQPEVLLLDEPTIGIDVKSREEILTLVDHITTTMGKAVLYLTNDYSELLRISDRLFFFQDGKMVRELTNTGFTTEDILLMQDQLKEATYSYD